MRHMLDPDLDADEDRDLPLERRITECGQTAVIYPTHPHGFWRIRLEKKKTLPRALDSAYTGFLEAEKAVTTYFNALKAAESATPSN